MLIDDFLDEGGAPVVKLVQAWMEKAAKEGVLNDEERITYRSMRAMIKNAERQNLIPEELSADDAMILVSYVVGFGRGFKTGVRNAKHTD